MHWCLSQKTTLGLAWQLQLESSAWPLASSLPIVLAIVCPWALEGQNNSVAVSKGHSPLSGVFVMFGRSKGKVLLPGFENLLLPSLLRWRIASFTRDTSREAHLQWLSCYGSPRSQYLQILRLSHYCVNYQRITAYLPKTRTVYPTLILKKIKFG